MRLLIIALLVAGTAAAQTTEMYRTVSADGTITFSDVPLSDNSERIEVLVRSGTTRTQEQATPEPVSAEMAAQMQQNCTRAREQLQNVSGTAQLYRILANGERQFLTDEELATAREQAQAEVTRWCGATTAAQ
jgi:hypothetical protein